MIALRENEKILLVLRHHWIVITEKTITTVVLLLLPILFVAVESVVAARIGEGVFQPLFFFLVIIYWMVVFAGFLMAWIDYWLDIWIITSERVIAVEQYSLFNRKISEFSVARVQDVTIAIPNILATLFGYGNVIVQTAGEVQFSITRVPNCEKAKDVIMSQSEYLRNSSSQKARL